MDRQTPALVVVHGIGTQQRGDTLWQCAGGLLGVLGGAELTDAAGKRIELGEIKTSRLDHVHLRQGSIDISLHEAHWADLLPDEMVANGFSQFEFEETTWFGYLNWKAGLLPQEQYSRALVIARTLELWFLQVIMSLSLEIVTTSAWVRSTILDQTAGDVWNYVHSLAGEVKDGSPLNGAAERILDRFQQACERASSEGAPVHVIAHSLGSVIAYHGMTRRLPAGAIARLVTIGSPLEKVRFLWAKLVPTPQPWAWEWWNFHAPSDPVSGSLKRFNAGTGQLENHRLWGLGGYGEAHVGYFRDIRVMAPLARGLGLTVKANLASQAPPWWRRRLIDIAVPLLTLVVTALGAALTVAFFYAIVWITGALFEYPVSWFSPAAGRWIGHAWRTFWGWLVPVMWIVFLTKDGYSRCCTRHTRRWL